MTVKLVTRTDKAEELLVYMARVSNPANQLSNNNNERLINYLIKHRHWSPFEMCHLVLEINTTRSIAAQILRHRSFSFQEFSQRYADVKELGYPEIPHLRRQDTKNRQNSIDDLDPTTTQLYYRRINQLFEESQDLYREMVFSGVAKETAREVGEATRAELAAKKLNIRRAKAATAEEIAKKAEDAAEVAAKNDDIARELILDFQARTGKTIASETAEGKLVLDAEKARQAGVETAEEVAESNKGTVREFLRGDSSQTEAALLAGMGDEITQPLLKPEKFDALVAIAADYQQKYPDAFDNDRTVIDNLFDLTVNRELVGGPELIDDLNKYGLSFEDYILTVVGSGSEAGRILNRLSQIRRARPTGDAGRAAENAAARTEGILRRSIMRLGNGRRGGLVSQWATAARNVTSAVVRAPLESLGNVMDTALYRATNEGTLAGIRSLFSGQNWRDSFSELAYMFSRPDVARAYSEFILTRPELTNQYDRMFNNINEIQRMTGRGSGTAFDRVVSLGEDTVDFLNIPNRWQEHLIRRGVFFGELQRLTRN